jgi:glycosyltransferase involved in cell wall biosynthesis
VAALGPTKGVEVLLSAAARLRRAGRRFTLRIVGDGPLREPLEAQARGLGLQACVRFEGAADREGVARALRTAAVFALPCVALQDGRRHDGLPVALLEAMASGLAVVATPVGGIPEVVAHGTNGWLVPPGDGASLAGALAALLADGSMRARLGAAARDTIVRGYEADAAARRLAGWITESAAPARPVVRTVAWGARA